MKIVKSVLQMVFTGFGLLMAMLFLYFCTVENPASDWFVATVTSLLSAIISLWICDDKLSKDGKDDNQ